MINYAVFVKEGVSRKEVEAMINNVIADHSGIRLSEITPEKSFNNDLGLD